jgi:hypothetical protein
MPSLDPEGSDALAVNFAGPRESESPGIYGASRILIAELLWSAPDADPGKLAR